MSWPSVPEVPRTGSPRTVELKLSERLKKDAMSEKVLTASDPCIRTLNSFTALEPRYLNRKRNREI